MKPTNVPSITWFRPAPAQSRIEDYPLTTGIAHANTLALALVQFGSSIRQAINTVAGLSNATTSDLFTKIFRSVDKSLWKFEAHGQA